MEYTYNGVTFDDFVIDEDGQHVWSQVCPSCAKKFNFSENILDNAGSGICGVDGCNNESDYYIDFK